MNEKELLEKIDVLKFEKTKEISNGNFVRAAQIRDEIKKYTNQLENLRNNI